MTTYEIQKTFETVTIIGLGLMGGSLAQAIQRKLPGIRLLAVDCADVLNKPQARQLIDSGFTADQLAQAAAQADLLVLATPINTILDYLPLIGQAVRPGTVITDMGSTKSTIVQQAADTLPDDVHFIGGHPMTGSEGHGFEAADPLLFENAVYVLTPHAPVPSLKIQALGNLLENLGAKVLFLSPPLHDRIAAAVSHLPQLLAVTLTQMVAGYQGESSHYLKLAAGGFRDMTRIAASPWAVWEDIIQTNSAPIVEFLDVFIHQLETSKAKISTGDLKQDFIEAGTNRLSIPRDTRGFLKPQFDLIVWVEDKPGVIADVASTLAALTINIKDIEVLKVREGDAGTLRLALESQDERAAAGTALTERGYITKDRTF